jgi:two-component system response regulator ResD
VGRTKELQIVPHISEWPAVVVCEPNDALLVPLCDHLTADHFKALPAPSASAALRICRNSNPDLMLLDMALPDGSGLDVLRAIRGADGTKSRLDPRLPILVVSGNVANLDRLRALEEGADDYLSMPTSYEELRGRIVAVLRRRQPPTEGPVRVGEIVIDPARRKVLVGEREVHLAKKEFGLLRVLASDPTRVFIKAELMRLVWGGRPGVATRTLDSHASRLRRKLDPEFTRYVVNCWGIGYRLIDD